MSTTVTIHKAKTQLSKLIARAEAGEEIVIARGKQPVVTLALVARKARRKFGAFKESYPNCLPRSSSILFLTTNWRRGRVAMKVLLDSHIFAWFVVGSRLCPADARDLISNPDTTVFVSAATVWELATKSRLGKWPEAASIVANLDAIMTSLDFKPLPIALEHGRVAGLFESAHKDPFDRMLAAQSKIESMPLVTVDPKFATFGTTTTS